MTVGNDNVPMSAEDIAWYQVHEEEFRATKAYVDTECGGDALMAVARLLRIKEQHDGLNTTITTVVHIQHREALWEKFQRALDEFRGPLTLFAARQFAAYTDKIRKIIEALPELPSWRHTKRQSVYHELLRGELQAATTLPQEGDIIVAYMGEDGKIWMRKQEEFTDGRFECLTTN